MENKLKYQTKSNSVNLIKCGYCGLFKNFHATVRHDDCA